jgi:hypothetical protein
MTSVESQPRPWVSAVYAIPVMRMAQTVPAWR